MDSISNQFIELWEYVTGPELWITIGTALFKAIAILLIAMIIVRIGIKVINRLFESRSRGPLRITERREVTLKKLIKNTLKYTVYFMAFMMILQEAFDLPIGSLLAGAGVAGIAIGFGAQNLVRDIISGFFIIFEDQFSVGDYVRTSGVEGFVEEIGMRTTKIESWTGEQHVLPNGSVTQVTNYSIHNGLAVVDVNVPYENDVLAAEQIIDDVAKKLPDRYEEIVKDPEIIGVQTLETSHYAIRIIAETLPSYQWAGARIIRKEIKEVLYKKGIQIPAPRLVMYSRNQEPNSLQIDPEREV
ncbi:mechanosensitive ion channel family protein [Lentibacillus sp. CBA3610]|uniref:mechanosensitive ion channel family protein n=1 Tax=Lentibacillus sp. CBA3610 TaxID=2518176 RepID=UPI0015954663|nr:mechanosensitive ion channel family protein [Lentibacillus sp. CBA3610]QKY70824.1 mechanosensitive ion channel family protein [Lentibacillus sp. CBA3610]